MFANRALRTFRIFSSSISRRFPGAVVMGEELLIFLVGSGIVLLAVSPIVLLVLQFSVLRRQKEAGERLESWIREMRRELRESRRLIEDLAGKAQATGVTLPLEPREQPRARAEEVAMRSAEVIAEPVAIFPAAMAEPVNEPVATPEPDLAASIPLAEPTVLAEPIQAPAAAVPRPARPAYRPAPPPPPDSPADSRSRPRRSWSRSGTGSPWEKSTGRPATRWSLPWPAPGSCAWGW